ncbi:MAG: hypothetical protein JNM91_05695 [Flavobacteriales bacterium]|nr:hypothetical protein [Flavobacteriales bacterium]
MHFPNTLRACVIAGALVSASVTGVLAQSFQINGRLKVDGGSLDGARVVVFKNGEKLRTVNSGLSKFSLDLDLNANYILAFEKDGFVTKKLSFDTHAPAEAVANGFTPFDFAVNMFKQYDDVNMVVFNQPVGMIRYDAATDDFDYDTDYTRSIQAALEEAMKEVAQKQEQEKVNGDQEAARKAQEEKARQKAEADKAKADAEAARLKAKQDKEAAIAAQREKERAEAEAKKQEAARKQEEARAAAEQAKAKPKPKPDPEPPPPPKKQPPPPQKEPPPVVAKKPKPEPPPARVAAPPKVVASATPAHSGEEQRRPTRPTEGSATTSVERAKENSGTEVKPVLTTAAKPIERKEELIVEPRSVTTRIALDDGVAKTEYLRVAHKFGGVFYFKNGQSISQVVYEQEALAENR